MRTKIIFFIVVATLLLLDFAALDDITTGNEPDYTGEWITLIISLPILAFIFYKLFARKRVRKLK